MYNKSSKKRDFLLVKKFTKTTEVMCILSVFLYFFYFFSHSKLPWMVSVCFIWNISFPNCILMTQFSELNLLCLKLCKIMYITGEGIHQSLRLEFSHLGQNTSCCYCCLFSNSFTENAGWNIVSYLWIGFKQIKLYN